MVIMQRILVVALPALVSVSLLTGCGDDNRTQRTALDSTLTRAEGLMSVDRDREASEYLLASLTATPDMWQGPSAPDGFRLLGDLYRTSARFDSAMVFYHQAAEQYRGQGRRSDAYAMTLANGELLCAMERRRDAATLYDETLRLATVFGDSDAARDVLWRKLAVHRALGQDEEEDAVLERLRTSARIHNDRQEEARVAFSSAMRSADRRERTQAVDLFLQAVMLAHQAQDSLLGTRALMHLALSLDALGRPQDAMETFRSALQRTEVLRQAPAFHLELLFRIGNFSLRQHQNVQAVQMFRSALFLAQQAHNATAEIYATTQISLAGYERDRQESLQQIQSAYEQCRRSRFGPGAAYTLLALGSLAERENRLTDAEKLYTSAVSQQEALFRSRAPDDVYVECEMSALGLRHTDASRALIGLLLQTGKTDEAFLHQARYNARRFQGDVSVADILPGPDVLDARLREFAHQRAVHVGAESENERLFSSRPENRQLGQAIASILSASAASMRDQAEQVIGLAPSLSPLVAAEGLSTAELRKRLPENSVVVTFFPTTSSLSVAALSRSGETFRVSSRSSEQVLQWCQEYVEKLQARRTEADSLGPGSRPLDHQIQDLARNLYEALVLPVEGTLQSGTQVTVVFPAGMTVIPFHALRRSASAGSPYLAERFAVSYTPLLELVGTKPPSQKRIQDVTCLGFAGTTAWDVEYELRDVQYFYKAARLLFGRAATLDTVRHVRTDVLHIAAEVRFGRRQQFLQGYLVLSDGITLTGQRRVPLSSLFGLPSNTCVILSNLAGGTPSMHAGVPYALLVNGSSMVVTTAFLPLRGAKKIFGEYFYTTVQSGGSGEVAFRKAQLEMISRKEWSAPHLWAPLMLWTY